MMPEASAVTAALLGAVAYGTGDFLGGRASLRLSTPLAVAIAQTVAVTYMATLFIRAEGSPPGALALYAGLLAGLAYAAGLMLLYHGFAHGRIGIVAPLCGLFAILIPLGGDIHLERALGEWALIGIGFCALAVVFIAGSGLPGESQRSAGRSVAIGIMSGIGYGVADLVIGLVPAEEAAPTLLVTRGVAATIAIVVLMTTMAITKTRETRQFAGVYRGMLVGGIVLAAAAGAFDLLGQIGYVTAAAHGSMGLAAALVALFPAVSVILAVLVLKERVTPRQLVGFAVSVAGVVMVSV